MKELKVLRMRQEILELCDFFETLIATHELKYREEESREKALIEIAAIRDLAAEAKEFTLGFVGEYSSGKTTLINLLTQANLNTGSTVTTQKAQKLQWHNITIVDTPGMGSGFKEHDDITKAWLSEADLLVYVLTPDLFNRHSGERFLRLLDEYKRDNELMLVMNMIDQEGNPVQVYREELQNAIDPRPLEVYFPTFVSALYKQKSLEKKYDSEDREYFAEKSRFDTFLNTLNHFIMERREKAALSTPLTRLQILSRKIGFKSHFDEENALLNMQIATYERIKRDISAAYGDFVEAVKNHATGTAGEIFALLDDPDENLQALCEDRFREFGENVEHAMEGAIDLVAFSTQRLKDRIDEIQLTSVYKSVRERMNSSEALEKVFTDFASPGRSSLENQKLLTKMLVQVNEIEEISGMEVPQSLKNIMSSKNVFDFMSGLASNVDASLILKLGYRIGHQFRPWEAVKLSSKFTKAVPILNIASVVWEVAYAFRTKKKEDERNKQLREFKQEIQGLLDQAVNDTSRMVNKMVVGPVDEFATRGLELLREKKLEILKFDEETRDQSLELEQRRRICLELFEEIYDPAGN